jgi:hypothetical protein
VHSSLGCPEIRNQMDNTKIIEQNNGYDYQYKQ